MHGVKKNIKRNDYNYKVNRKLNDNNSHRVVRRYMVVVDGIVDSYHPSVKKAYEHKMWLEESFYNQDEPVYPHIEVICDEMELYYGE